MQQPTDPVALGLWALAAVLLGQGLWLAVSPSSAYEQFANFGPYNPHDLRDMAAFPIAAAIAVVVSVRRVDWRVPVLAVVALQHLLHTANHVIDVADASPSWVGPADVVTLAAIAALAAWVMRRQQEVAA